MNDTSPCNSWTLNDLPFAARFTLAVFLVSVGLGYFSALVNLHFQTATPGAALPTSDDVLRDYSGTSRKTSQLERLLTAHPSLPFNGQGSMRSVFTRQRASGWARERKRRAKELGIVGDAFHRIETSNPKVSKEIDRHVARSIDGERLALIAWLRNGAPREAYEDDAFALKGETARLMVSAKMFVEDAPKDEPAVKIKSILEMRCVRCHKEDVGGAASQFPLETWQDVALYTKTEQSTGKSLTKLALTTHVHLLAFSLLYGATGVLFALTGCSRWARTVIAPLPLLVQIVEIGFWWLARLDEPCGPLFAHFIPITGGIVALGLGLQIVLTLFSLFGKYGRALLIGLILAVVLAAFGVKDRVVQYLAGEKAAAYHATSDSR